MYRKMDFNNCAIVDSILILIKNPITITERWTLVDTFCQSTANFETKLLELQNLLRSFFCLKKFFKYNYENLVFTKFLAKILNKI